MPIKAGRKSHQISLFISEMEELSKPSLVFVRDDAHQVSKFGMSCPLFDQAKEIFKIASSYVQVTLFYKKIN